MLLLMLACTSKTDTAASSKASTDTGPFYSAPADCGEGIAPGSVPGLVRWPYVQHVTPSAATVAWGVPSSGEGVLTFSRGEEVHTVPATARPMSSSERDTFRLFSGRVEGLTPGTEYCYSVSVDGVTYASGLTVTTAPDSEDAPVRFLVIGDFGSGSPEQAELVEVIKAHAEGVGFWLTTGDNAYSSGTYGEFHDNVFTVYQELLTGIPLYPTWGNHDYKTDDARPGLENFFLPENAWKPEHRERYYSFDWGPLHIVAADSEEPLVTVGFDGEQSEPAWIDADLTADDSPWPIIAFHKPIYSGHESRGPDAFSYIHLLPLVEKHSIPLGLTGHNHFYERFEPIKGGVADADGTTWIVTGGGGQGLYEGELTDNQVVFEGAHHFMVGEASRCTLSMQAIGLGGVVLDSFSLERCQ